VFLHLLILGFSPALFDDMINATYIGGSIAYVFNYEAYVVSFSFDSNRGKVLSVACGGLLKIKKVMPQFDIYIIFSQVFWFILKFFIFYSLILKMYIVQLAEALKIRKKLQNKYLSKVSPVIISKFKTISLYL